MAYIYSAEIAGRVKESVLNNANNQEVQAALNDQLPNEEVWSSVATLRAADQVLTDLVSSTQSEVNSLSALASLNSYGSYTSVATLTWANIFNIKYSDSFDGDTSLPVTQTSLPIAYSNAFGFGQGFFGSLGPSKGAAQVQTGNNYSVSFEIRSVHNKLTSFMILGTDKIGGGNMPQCLYTDIDVLGEKYIPFTFQDIKRDSLTRGDAYRVRSDYDPSFIIENDPITITIKMSGSVPYTWWSNMLRTKPAAITFTTTFCDLDPRGSVIQSIPSLNYSNLNVYDSSAIDLAMTSGIQSMLQDGGVQADSSYSISDMLIRVAEFLSGKFASNFFPTNSLKGTQIASSKPISYIYSIFETYLGTLISEGGRSILTTIVEAIPDLALLL